MNKIEARRIIKNFNDYMGKFEEARDNNILGDFTIFPHNISEILTACDVEIEYCRSIMMTSDDDDKIMDAGANLMSKELMKKGLLHVFGGK